MKIELAPRKSTFNDMQKGEVFRYEFKGDVGYCIKMESPFTEFNACCLDDGEPLQIAQDEKVAPVRARLVVEE